MFGSGGITLAENRRRLLNLVAAIGCAFLHLIEPTTGNDAVRPFAPPALSVEYSLCSFRCLVLVAAMIARRIKFDGMDATEERKNFCLSSLPHENQYSGFN